MTRPPADTTPDANPPVVLDYATTLVTAKVPTAAILVVAVLGTLIPALFLSFIPLSLLDSYGPWPVVAGIGLMLLGVTFFIRARCRARPMRRRKFILTGTILFSMGASAMCGSVLILKYSTYHSLGSPPRTACATQLRGIGSAMYICAGDAYGEYRDAFPDDLHKLIESGNITPRIFRCPSATLFAKSYYYVPGYGVNSDFTQIIMYENPRNHGGKGGNVLYQDGHVAFITSPQYEQLINAITLPDGSPHTPFKD